MKDLVGDKPVIPKGSLVEEWAKSLAEESTFNIPSYTDCFIAENLLRLYIQHTQMALSEEAKKEAQNGILIGCNLCVQEMSGEELLEKMAASLASLPYESPAFCQISGASYGYLTEYALSDDGEKIYTIIDPTVNGELLDMEKIYQVASGFNMDETDETEPLLSTMEEAAAAMGEYLRSGNVVILPDVPVPDHRIVPMDEIPADAVAYQVIVDTENMLP